MLPPRQVNLAPSIARESHYPTVFWKGRRSALTAGLKGLPRCLVNRRRRRTPSALFQGEPNFQGSRHLCPFCLLLLKAGLHRLPFLPNLFPSLDLCRSPAGLDAAGSQTLQVQGWDQRLPAPRFAPPACGQPEFPAVVSAPASAGRSAHISLGHGPCAPGAVAGCTGPGAARAWQCPPALSRQTWAPPVGTSDPPSRPKLRLGRPA